MCLLLCLPAVEELQQFMAHAKLQVPTTRERGGEPPTPEKGMDSVKEGADGDVVITRVDFIPTSSGRERYGSGTATWPKYSLDEPVLMNFCR